jgi:general nucleoside transport system permease protein
MKGMWKQRLLAPLFAIGVSALLTSLIVMSLGESPRILWEAFSNTFFNSFGLGYTLFYATPLIFTGLAVAVCFHAGLFNIGAEGQLHLGAIGILATAILLPNTPGYLAIPLGILVSMISGGLWGLLAGFFKSKRGSHEVIVTILLNFIGITLVNYLILYPFKNTQVQNPETLEIGTSFTLPTLSQITARWGSDLFRTTPANVTLFLAILAALGCYYLLFHTPQGFEIRALGQNPTAAKFNGISLTRHTLGVFFLAGALAGLTGVNEVMGYQHKLIEGFSPQYGFTGIAVALLARNHPLGVLLAAFLFGSIHNGAREIEFESEKITKEISVIMEAILIILIAGSHYFLSLWDRWSKRRNP